MSKDADLTSYDTIAFDDYLAHVEHPPSWNNLCEKPCFLARLPELKCKNVLDIAQYYTDADAAEADGQEIIERIQSYEVGLQLSTNPAFTDFYPPGEPVVKTYPGGDHWSFRYLLFLAADPSIYVK